MNTTPTEQARRLRLAARAEVAANLARAIEEKNAPAVTKAQPLSDALNRFKALHGYDVDPTSRRDSAMLLPLLEATGAARLTKKEIEAAHSAEAENHEFSKRAVDAMDALAKAWERPEGGADQTLIAWIGCTPQELRAAVQEELWAWEAVLAEHAERLTDGRAWQCWNCRVTYVTARWPRPASGRCGACEPPTHQDL